jgi:hypothetical protein
MSLIDLVQYYEDLVEEAERRNEEYEKSLKRGD